jgi:hypothetical protein
MTLTSGYGNRNIKFENGAIEKKRTDLDLVKYWW